MTSLLMLATNMVPAGAPDIENPKERFLPARKKGAGPTGDGLIELTPFFGSECQVYRFRILFQTLQLGDHVCPEWERSKVFERAPRRALLGTRSLLSVDQIHSIRSQCARRLHS